MENNTIPSTNNELLLKIEQTKIKIASLKRQLLVCALLFVFACFFSLLSILSMRRQGERIDERDQFFESLVASDSTIITRDIVHDVEFYMGGKKMNKDEFVSYVNSLLNSCYDKLDSLEYYREYFQLTHNLFDVKFEQNVNDSTGRSRVLSYPAIYSKENKERLDTMAVQSQLYKKIIDKYPIKVKQEGNLYIITSPQIDSAMALLPFFKDNLEALPDGTGFVVTHYGTAPRK